MRPVFALAALAAATIACGGGTPTSPSLPPAPFSGSDLVMLTRGVVRATIDGSRWGATIAVASVGASPAGAPPRMFLTARADSGVSLTIGGPLTEGTHGMGATFFGVSEGLARSWSVTPFVAGSDGTLALTTAAATRVAGTFSFTAASMPQILTPATRVVTDGTFDLSQ